MKELKNQLIILLCFFCFGCTTNTTNIDNTAFGDHKINNSIKENLPIYIPEWYINEINNNEEYIYGIGEGKSLAEATNNALANMIERLQVLVSTNSILETSSNNNSISQQLSLKTKTQTSNVIIQNYQIQNQQQINDRFYVQLKVNKLSAINEIKENIKNKGYEIDHDYKISANKDSLIKFKATENISKNISYIKNASITLLLLDSSIDIQPFLRDIVNYTNKFYDIKPNLKLYINKNSGYFYAPLKKYLLSEGYNIVPNMEDANIIFICKNKKFLTSSDKGEYYISSKIEVITKENYTNNITTKIFNLEASSNNGRQETIESLKEQFYINLVNNGVI
ncbi:LPP20 family lipoprotein [Pseudofrancisella aestuarii]|uniref:LPP20 family lipoprotein n=1 Tax=Pseudofrancisella aestuarii TaxID=2670347 RepID=A0ABV9TCA8_9GAMM|nr:LPP20 family lipoprotein [Pseudofrancisella aestuarii]